MMDLFLRRAGGRKERGLQYYCRLIKSVHKKFLCKTYQRATTLKLISLGVNRLGMVNVLFAKSFISR